MEQTIRVSTERVHELLENHLAVAAIEHLENDAPLRFRRLLDQGNPFLARYLAKEVERALIYMQQIQERQPELPPITRNEMVLQFLMEQIGTEEEVEAPQLTPSQKRTRQEIETIHGI